LRRLTIVPCHLLRESRPKEHPTPCGNRETSRLHEHRPIRSAATLEYTYSSEPITFAAAAARGADGTFQFFGLAKGLPPALAPVP